MKKEETNMLCQNCGKNEVTLHYTQIINGVKKEMALCDTCAKELGLEKLDFSMPIDFSSFLGNFFGEYEDGAFLPELEKSHLLACKHCGLSYEDFVNTGKFGCARCYDTFENKLKPILKNLHGASKHVGRNGKQVPQNAFKEEIQPKDEKTEKIASLQKKIQELVKEEKYEEAAKIRDEIKKLGKE